MQSYNFSAGPAVMPSEVLTQIQFDLDQSQEDHMSILEISHRSLTFDKIVDQAKARLRELMDLPQDYEVLFVQGGGSLQFEMVPLNFANQAHQIAVLDSGNFAYKAAQAAQAEGISAKIVASSRDEKYRYLPQLPVDFSAQAYDYLHITTNNTIEGTCYHQSNLPQTTGPLVADMSSNILAEPYDIRNFDLIFAGAQKNLGPAGVTVVVVKKSWLAQQRVTNVGPMMRYQSYLDKNSMYNTPPVFNIYALNLVLGWVQDQGGVPAMYAANQKKAQLLYDYLDKSNFYHPLITGVDRSLTNVVFSTGNGQLDQTIAQQAQEYGLYNLAGHRSVGGFRASLYNAQPLAAVTALIDYLDKAQKEHRNER